MLRQIFSFLLAISFASPLAAQVDRTLKRDQQGADGQKRLALVIGNGAYTNASRLANPTNDATDMTATLKALGFEVISGTDANLVEMRRLIRVFGERLEATKGVGLFFYAGHGVEVRGRNFLVPVDADISREVETEDYAVDLNSVLRQMDAAGNGFNIVILDACRNNPFARGWNRSGDAGGLANVLAPTGTYIAFAAAPGTTAADGKGTRNGVFTAALLANLKRPGLKLEDVFKATRERVMSVTSSRQVPWDSSSVQGDFYFSAAKAAGAVPEQAPSVQVASAEQVEQEYWDAIRDSRDKAAFEGYLKEYPDGRFAALARLKIGSHGPAPAAVPAGGGNTGGGTVARGTVRKNSIGMELVYIPPGEFMMGSSEDDISDAFYGAQQRNKDAKREDFDAEKPQHRVRISEGFWMGKYEVTQAQWRAVMGKNPSVFDKKCGDPCPVERVSWDDAKEFLRKLNQANDGFIYSLPSEAQWEYAARAGTTGLWAGDLEAMGWYGQNSSGKTHPVGQKQPNAFGLYDMHGNVKEWCEGWYGPYSAGDVTDPIGASTGKYRVLRGGSYGNSAGYTRSAFRFGDAPEGSDSWSGFRLLGRLK
jgi:formylglycine-generating enzyme required for sulfatase activity